MKPFLDHDFLLSSDAARRLYHDYAADQPIYDYHSHLDPRELAEDRRFENLTQIWLAGDHYKWRAMRTAGVDERLITGSASDREKFEAWARVVPLCIGNPLYHWTHMELRRPFGIADRLLGPATADAIWRDANALLAQPELSARGILKQMHVRMVGTTDDPLDGLEHHAAIAADPTFDTLVLPTWRPDAVLKIEQPGFADYVERLADCAGLPIRGFDDLLEALERRMDLFDARGCRSADHGADRLRFAAPPDGPPFAAAPDGAQPSASGPARSPERAFAKRLAGARLDDAEHEAYVSALQLWLGREYARRGWVMQLHIGALRDNNSRMLAALGPNTGFDSIGDEPFARPLAALLDALDRDGRLPRTILYCLNPRDNEVIATMTGNFQGDRIPGKVQFGSAWWFNDQQDGIRRHLTGVAQMSLLSKFVGMLTDSRSLLSFTRHEYFRRILCDLVGGWIERGEAPADYDALGKLVADVSCWNTVRYLRLSPATVDGGD